MGVRIAVLNGGIHEERIFGTYPDIKLLYIGKSNLKISIFKYDIIFIPFHIDQIYLYSLKKLLEEYVIKGGILVILGATKECDRDWIPFCQWNNEYPQKPLKPFKRETCDEKLIFSGIESVENLKYHGTYYSHGTLSPTPQNTEKLLTDQDNLAVILIIREGLNGTFFATTLDPDFHSVIQVPGPTQEESRKTQESARRLLTNIYGWAKLESTRKEKKFLNKLTITWIFKRSIWLIKHALNFFIPTITALLLFSLSLNKTELEKMSYPIIVVGIINILSAIFTCYSYICQLLEKLRKESV